MVDDGMFHLGAGLRALKARLKGELVVPADGTYQEAIGRWSRLAERPAAGVVFPQDETDIATTLAFAKESKVEIAVKGGGHSTSGASSTDGGIVIDLSRYFTRVALDVPHQLVHGGGGATWRDVDQATVPHGLATVAGTVDHTGVGGRVLIHMHHTPSGKAAKMLMMSRLTLGGGYGFLTGRHGLTIDNLRSARVVTASGCTLEASEEVNPDLFFGIRGGGMNFGVVTQFTMNADPVPARCWSSIMYFTFGQLEVLVPRLEQWRRQEMGESDCVLLGLSLDTETREPSVMLACTHLGDEQAGRERFAPFYRLDPQKEESRMKPYIQLNQDDSVPHGRAYHYTGGIVRELKTDRVKAVLAKQRDFAAAFPGPQCFVGIEIFPTDQICAVGNDEMAFNGRGRHSNVFVDINWDEGEYDLDEVRKWGREVRDAIQGPAAEDDPFYGSYEGVVSGSDKVKQLFGPNYPRLQVIKAKYDPDSMFRKWFPIEPANHA